MLELEKKELSILADNKTNNLLDAISIVAESVAKKYKYDQTIEAKIVSVARKDQGIYKCEYEEAIFDAYSSDTQSFYENETVYVNVPQGDFSKQKHIIGRKMDLEKAPNKTFNFKMPFDDFVGLENLTIENPYVRPKSYGFWANYALHGNKQETSSEYNSVIRQYTTRLSAADNNYNTALRDVDSRYNSLLLYLDNQHLGSLNIQVISSGSRLENVMYDSEHTYLDRLMAAYEAGQTENALNLLQSYVQHVVGQDQSSTAYLGQDDVNLLSEAARKYHETATIAAKLSWESARTRIINDLNSTHDLFTGNNYNLLWSWSNTDGQSKVLIETKLGIALDIKTDLHDSLPRKGEYGLRIIITGLAKQTDDAPSQTKTTDIYWTNDQMYGNTYAFYSPYRQQRIIDISDYLTLDRIDIFFYQDTDNEVTDGTFVDMQSQSHPKRIVPNFIDSYGNIIPFTYDSNNGISYSIPYNIFYDNLEVLLGLTAEECQTDRVILYSYGDPIYGQDEFSTEDRELKDSRELKFAWVHKMDDGEMVLVNHALKEHENDIRALETYGAEIFWYHYEYGAPQDTDQLVYKYGGVNWAFLEEEKIFYELIDDSDIVHRYQMYGKFDITVQPDIQKAVEKWKAVVVCKGVPYASTPIVFKNVDGSIENNPDYVNDVVIKILHETLDNEGNNIIKENNSLTNFYVYNEEGQCIQDEDGRNWSDLWFYAQIWIKNYLDNQYYPIALANEDGYNPDSVSVDWILPGANSMLHQFFDVSDIDLQSDVLAPTVETNQPAFNAAIRKSTKKFHIKSHLDMRAINNTIAAIVKRNGRVYKPQITFDFGLSGTMGTPYTVGLVQDLPTANSLIKDTVFRVRAVVYDEHGREAPNKNYIFSWELLAPTIITAGELNELTGLTWQSAFSNIVPLDDGKGNIKNVITGYIRNDFPPVFRVTVRNATDYPITATKAFSLSDNSAINTQYEINCPNKIEFKSDGTIPTTINAPFEVNVLQTTATRYTIHPTWTLEQYKLIGNNWNLLQDTDVKCIGLKQRPVAQVNLATNSNPTVYVNQTNDQYDFDQGFSITLDEIHNTGVVYDSIKQELKRLYDLDTDNHSESSIEVLNADLERYNTRLDNLNAAINTIIPSYVVYSLDPYVGYTGGQNVPWQWTKDLDNLYYTIIQYVEGGIYFKQAIAFTRNIYSSSLVNSWDGSTLELDDANSAVLAKMISAGAKDGQGRFTGVMMGDWHEKADSSLDVIGLYGVKYGEQVFGFKTDGTGFIGKSGKGRIEFDGNKSLISNHDKTCYINLDPVTFNGQSIDDYIGFSQYFLYAKTKKTSSPLIVGNEVDGLDQSTYWASEFLKDSTNDYFIVDPNNGVLTSGGIIARYGKIGNWMISDQGLYQRKTASELRNNRYMYLGHADLNTSDQEAVENKYLGLYNALELKYQQALLDAKNKFQTETIEVLGEYYKNIFNYDPLHYYNYGWPYESFVYALTDTLNSTSRATPLGAVKSILQSNLKYYIEREQRTGYHKHFTNGVAIEYNYYTGDRNVFNLFARGMVITEPSSANLLTDEWVANHSKYTNGAHRTVTFPTNSLSPSAGSSEWDNVVSGGIEGITIDSDGESSGGIEFPPSNIPSEYTITNYYQYVRLTDDEGHPTNPPEYDLIRYWETANNPLVIEYNQDGYASEAALELAEQVIPQDLRYAHCCKKISQNTYRFYFCSGGVAFNSGGGGMGGPNNGGSGSPNPSVIPSTTATYYSTLDSSKSWARVYTNYSAYRNAETIDFNYASTYTRDKLTQMKIVAYGVLKYYQDAYNDQLEEMLAAGRAELEGEALAEYERRKAQKETEYKNYIATVIEPLYEQLRKRLDERKAKEYADLMEACDNRYAIFAGYTPTSDPLFSVNWRGYFTARSGKIGNTSPWYIADRGLTQKNNSGTIFLGDPATDGSETFNVFLGQNTYVNDSRQDQQNISLLNNGASGLNRGPRYWSYNSGQLENTYGEFAIYAGSTDIKFGVRLDGSLLATRANIGSWLVDNSTIRSLPQTKDNGDIDYNYQIILDAADPKIIFGSSDPRYPATILYGNGMLKLSALQGAETSSVSDGNAMFGGTINLGGYFLQGMTNAPISEAVLLGISHSRSTSPESSSAQTNGGRNTQTIDYKFGQATLSLPGKTYSKTTASHDNTTATWEENNPNI